MKLTFPLLLGTVFLVLKLTHVIAWSWWWVTCPFWAPLALVAPFLLVYLVALVIQGVCWMTLTSEERKRHRAAENLRRYAKALRSR